MRPTGYGRRPPLVLINGLAEQAESWFCNLEPWRRHFDVYLPNILAYEGGALHRRIESGQTIDVDYLVERTVTYLDDFIQRPPYFIVANSLGGKIAVELAVRRPEIISRLVLICPSGLSDEERLPVIEGVRRHDVHALVRSVFYNPRLVNIDLLSYYRQQFGNRLWRAGLMRTIRGTMDHRVVDLLPQVRQPTLLLLGQEDRIIDPEQTASYAEHMPNVRIVRLPRCGHAPQMEKPQPVNRLVTRFLLSKLATPALQSTLH
jgi:pimeloyl-ACP methyl ester carboxylesterase